MVQCFKLKTSCNSTPLCIHAYNHSCHLISNTENYWILREYYKYVLPLLTWIVRPIINLISGTIVTWERRAQFMVLWEYSIITPQIHPNQEWCNISSAFQWHLPSSNFIIPSQLIWVGYNQERWLCFCLLSDDDDLLFWYRGQMLWVV